MGSLPYAPERFFGAPSYGAPKGSGFPKALLSTSGLNESDKVAFASSTQGHMVAVAKVVNPFPRHCKTLFGCQPVF